MLIFFLHLTPTCGWWKNDSRHAEPNSMNTRRVNLSLSLWITSVSPSPLAANSSGNVFSQSLYATPFGGCGFLITNGLWFVRATQSVVVKTVVAAARKMPQNACQQNFLLMRPPGNIGVSLTSGNTGLSLKCAQNLRYSTVYVSNYVYFWIIYHEASIHRKVSVKGKNHFENVTMQWK